MKTPFALGFVAAVFIPFGLVGCGEADRTAEDGSFGDEMPEDLPAGRCGETESSTTASDSGCDTEAGPVEETSGSSTGGGVEDDCQSGEECLGGDVCAAGWDAEAGERLPFACEFTCIETVDEERYCADDTSCCDADAVCTPRGYCVLSS